MQSEEDTFRGTVQTRDLNGDSHTVIVPRRELGERARVWLTWNGAWTTTVRLTDPKARTLCELPTKAQHANAR